MKQLKKCKGVDPHYVEKGRQHELWLLEHCLADCLASEHRTTFKPYVARNTRLINGPVVAGV